MFGEKGNPLCRARRVGSTTQKEEIERLERVVHYAERGKDEMRERSARLEKRLDVLAEREPGICVITLSDGRLLRVRGWAHKLAESIPLRSTEAGRDGYGTRYNRTEFVTDTKNPTEHVVVHIIDITERVIASVVNPIAVVWQKEIVSDA